MWILILVLVIIGIIIASVILLNRYFDNRTIQKKQFELNALKNKVIDRLTKDKFIATKMSQFESFFFAIDMDNKNIMLSDVKYSYVRYARFSDIVNYEVSEDGEVQSSNHALGGAILFGVAGAVVGASMSKNQNVCSSLKLIVILNDILNPHVVFELMPKFGAYRNQGYYLSAVAFLKEVTSTLNVIKNQQSVIVQRQSM